jgi:hypothetical protein
MDAGMTPEAAIYQFLASFGIPAYAATSVPDQATFPYISYELVVGEWLADEVNMPVNVWYRTESEAAPNAKVREIGERIGMGGVLLHCDGGVLWVKKGSPWAQAVTVEGEDEKVKRRYININIEFLIAE